MCIPYLMSFNNHFVLLYLCFNKGCSQNNCSSKPSRARQAKNSNLVSNKSSNKSWGVIFGNICAWPPQKTVDATHRRLKSVECLQGFNVQPHLLKFIKSTWTLTSSLGDVCCLYAYGCLDRCCLSSEWGTISHSPLAFVIPLHFQKSLWTVHSQSTPSPVPVQPFFYQPPQTK